MNYQLLAGKNVIVQGITGSQGSFHTEAMLSSGTNIIAGVTPGKAGQSVLGIPVFDRVSDINEKIDASVVFVPAKFAKSAIIEAIEAEIPLIVVITEGIPVHDMLYIKQRLKQSKSQLIGPNSPGVIVPGVHKLGIIPTNMSLQGSVGIVSRSGTLTYEAMAGLSSRGVGQKYVIGIGGDPLKGTGFIDCLKLFENNPEVSIIVMIGEIGGVEELDVAKYIEANITKPVVSYIAGHHAPAGVQLGHAGAILGSHDESAAAKTSALGKAGTITTDSILTLINKVSELSTDLTNVDKSD